MICVEGSNLEQNEHLFDKLDQITNYGHVPPEHNIGSVYDAGLRFMLR